MLAAEHFDFDLFEFEELFELDPLVSFLVIELFEVNDGVYFIERNFFLGRATHK